LKPLFRRARRNGKGTLKLVTPYPSAISGKVVLALDDFWNKGEVLYFRILPSAMDKEWDQLLITFRL